MHTPASAHDGTAVKIHAKRIATLKAAFLARPERFHGRRPYPPSLPEVPRGFRTVHPLGWMSGKVKELPRPKKSFSPEFKDEAVKMVIEHVAPDRPRREGARYRRRHPW